MEADVKTHAMDSVRRRPRAGFTVAELLVSAVLTAVVFGIALPFLNNQSRAVSSTAGRLDAVQNARFAQNSIDRELRMVGVNTLGTQPLLVQADKYAVTFNADLTTRDNDDVWSIYYDPDADSLATIALQPPALALPVTGFQYPTAAVLDRDGLPGRAETISYWVSADSSSPRPNEYVLFRKVNRSAATVVATGLYIASGQPFFTYLWARDSTGVIDTVPASKLPLRHVVAQHGSLADTGETATLAAQVDRVRSVIITATGQYRDVKPNATIGRKVVRSQTSLINMTMLNRPSCGLAPDPVSLTTTLVTVGGQPDHIRLRWTKATDDNSGERDVERYLIYRTVNGSAYGEPIDEVPAGTFATYYTYDDPDVKRPPTSGNPNNNTFGYAVVVQDCQPQLSTLATAAALVVPTI